VIGEPHRAFYGNQYGLTFPLFEHYGVPLWVPEAGGPIDPKNEAHDLVMSVFGGMSKGERNRIKIRAKAAMGAQAKDEGRFLGGRPPYGYRIADAGPHPNPAKAADGKRLHKLELDPDAAAVVERIFAEFVAGSGFYAIAEGLTCDDIPCPSAHDRAATSTAPRSPGTSSPSARSSSTRATRASRCGTSSAKTKYGSMSRMSRSATRPSWAGTSPAGGGWSDKMVHPPIIDRETFDQVQAMVSGRAANPATHKPHRSRHLYALRGCVWCACAAVAGYKATNSKSL
jgi:hypothetical protein